MSIFQSSFPDYVFKQLKIREAIIQQGNDNSRFGRPQAKIKIGKDNTTTVDIANGAFYTNTIERQCTIRMSSGVNIDGSNEMAKRFILEGGTQKEGEGGQRDGFMHGDRKGNAYGDSRIFADADDGFGIVPMPGIVDANIRTASAYGSLRNAKVNFVCHNRRQLEVLERLYMRPGFPIMLEWGWAPFIDNDGDIETIVPKIGDFFTDYTKINDLQDEINKRKVDTGGNYDGFLGVCKNFEFKATPAGGYECSTDIIAMGEVLEGLKGKRVGHTLTDESGEEYELDEFEYYLTALHRLATNYELIQLTGEKKGEISNTIDSDPGMIVALTELARLVEEEEFKIKEDPEALKTQNVKKHKKEKRQAFGRVESARVEESENNIKSKSGEKLSKIDILLDNFIIKKGDLLIPKGDDEEVNQLFEGSPYTYIRWDFLSLLMNKYILEEYQKDENIAEVTWYNKKNQYFDYVRSNITDGKGNPLTIPTFQDEKTGKGDRYRDITQILDISCNPSKVLLPHQIPYLPVYLGGWEGSKLIQKKDKSEVDGEGYATQNSIGFTYLGVEYLLEKYKGMRYNSEGELNPNFKILNFLKEIWEKDINDACVGSHNFMVHHDKEDTTKVRVIDLIFQSSLQPPDLYEFNIQDNKSIVRDFNFNTTIPSALTATMAVVAQNPDSIDDMEGVTISAMNKGLTSRFSKPIVPINKDEESWNQRVEDENQVVKLANILFKYHFQLAIGTYGEQKNENLTHRKHVGVSKASKTYKSLINLIESLLVRYPLTSAPNQPFKIEGIYKAGHKRRKMVSLKSSIIPLKFTCKMDGIGGIVIGNVFKVDKKRLPLGYQGKDIAFMTHAENQTITSGQDWTTEISGQLLLLDLTKDSSPKEHHGIIISPGDNYIKDGIDDEKLSPTPEADKIRELLDRLSFTEKDKQLSDNGDITKDIGDIIANILVEIYLQRRRWGSTPYIEVTAGNDTSHAGGKGRHDKGRAVDIVITPRDFYSKPIDGYKKNKRNNYDSQLIIDRIENIIQGFVGNPSAGGTIRYLNEYNYASPGANAPHFHLSYFSEGGSEGGPTGFSFQQNKTGKPGEEGAIDNLTLSEQRWKNVGTGTYDVEIPNSQYYATNKKYDIDSRWYEKMKSSDTWPLQSEAEKKAEMQKPQNPGEQTPLGPLEGY